MHSLSKITLATALSLAALSASAADFSIKPTRIGLDAKRKVDTITLTSSEDRELSFEVTLMKWTQKKGGEWVEVVSKDLVVYPGLLKMAPKANGIVRVGTKNKVSDDVEGAYRLILQELPGGPTPEGSAVRLLTRVSLPIFLKPTNVSVNLSLQAARMGDGAKLTVINAGNVHLDPQTTKVEFLDAGGKTLVDVEAKPGPAYVLSGADSSWTQTWPAGICAKASSVKVTFDTSKNTLTAPLSGSCK